MESQIFEDFQIKLLQNHIIILCDIKRHLKQLNWVFHWRLQNYSVIQQLFRSQKIPVYYSIFLFSCKSHLIAPLSRVYCSMKPQHITVRIADILGTKWSIILASTFFDVEHFEFPLCSPVNVLIVWSLNIFQTFKIYSKILTQCESKCSNWQFFLVPENVDNLKFPRFRSISCS